MSAFSRVSLPAGLRSGGLGTQVVPPGQAGFDKARLASSPAADQHPAAAVFAESAPDVAAAARFAAERGQQVAAQAARHNALPLGLLPNFDGRGHRTGKPSGAAASVHSSGLGSASGGRALRTVEANAHAAAAVYLMKRAGATAMVVVDDGMSNSPVGLITEGDLAQSAADGDNLNEIRIRDLMATKRRSSARAASCTPVLRKS